MIVEEPSPPPGAEVDTESGSGPCASDHVEGVNGSPTDGAGDGGRRDLVLVQRCAWTLVWVGVLTTGLGYSASWPAGWWAAVLALVLVVVGLAGAAMVWLVRRPLSPAMQRGGLVAALVAAGASEGTGIHLREFYATDSAAFNQMATRLFLDGRDPYTNSLAGAARWLHPAASFWTYQVNGTHTVQVSYPAGSFLLQAPVMSLGLNHMATDWVDLVAWLVTGVLIFAMVPPVLKWLAPLLLLTGYFLAPFASGGTDALFVPFLVVAVWRWDRFPGRAVAWLPAWVGPVSLGIACSIKQTPWFCVPFLMVGVAAGARRAGGRPLAVALRYGAITLAAFLVMNAPFIIWSPSAWQRGTFLPMIEPLVGDGQGLVALALRGLTGGVVLPWLSVAAACALVSMLVAFALWEPRLKQAWLFLVPLVLLLPSRSLANYLTDFVPAALVAAVSVHAVRQRSTTGTFSLVGDGTSRRRLGVVAVTVPAVAAVGLVGVAMTSAPLQLSVDSVSVGGVATLYGGQHIQRVVVTVDNTSGSALTPHFMVNSGGGHPEGFWLASPVHGEVPVAPGATTEFALRPASYFAAPPHGQWWLVAAYTTSPNALSTSSLQYWRTGSTGP